jgi:large subunit ribosomal protein L4e
MEVNIYKLDGSVQEKVKLPEVFNTPYRPRIINRAVLAADSAKIQPKGASFMAGRHTTAVYIGRRADPEALINKGVARKPRAKNRKRILEGNVRGIPGTVAGPRAHPLKPEEIQKEEINKKERILALKSALGVLKDLEKVQKRGHKFDPKLNLPVVVVNDLENLSKTKDVLSFMKTIGIDADVERA